MRAARRAAPIVASPTTRTMATVVTSVRGSSAKALVSRVASHGGQISIF
jgi:hypothetical protein